MAKFGTRDPNADDAPPPVEREITPTPASSPPPPINLPPAATPVAAPADLPPPPDEPAKPEEHWMKAYWRPAMGWLYMLICFCDFVAFPIISMFMPVMIKGFTYVAWKSITLDNGGLIHLAFGGILGVTAYGRTQEKITK